MRYYDNRDILRGALLCCKCFDEHLPYVWVDDPDHDPDTDIRETRESELPWWIVEVDLPPPPNISPPEPHSPLSPPTQDPPPPSSVPATLPPSPARDRDAPAARTNIPPGLRTQAWTTRPDLSPVTRRSPGVRVTIRTSA